MAKGCSMIVINDKELARVLRRLAWADRDASPALYEGQGRGSLSIYCERVLRDYAAIAPKPKRTAQEEP
jgi:hypothetical protein